MLSRLMQIDYSGIFILICWLVFLVVWGLMAFRTKRTLERGGWTWRLVTLAVVLIFLLLRSKQFLGVLEGARLWNQTLLSGIIADLITLVGLGNLIWARVTLGANWSSDVVINENHELIERGPYHWVRHPIYSSLLLMALGMAVWSGHAIGFAIFLTLLTSLWIKARQEEKLLTKYFPEEYPSYRARVKALIPFIF